MVLTLNNTNTLTANEIIVNGTNLSDLYATINYVNTNSNGVSQTDFDSSIATLQSKDVSYNNTLTSHISLIDTNTTDIATHTNDISVLNTKQIQNFAGITDINTNLTNNYQTNTQLATNFYNKTEIDTTLGSYYTSAVIDAGFYNQTYINNNIYTKTEVDGLVGAGGGYTDTQIDNFLSLKEDKSRFTDNISFFPVIDCSRPTIIHQGLTLNNSTVNIQTDDDGLIFSNQSGDADKDVGVFKNATNYITLKGNKINAYATSDDSIANLILNPAGNIEFSNVILPAVGADLYRASGDTSYNIRIRDLQGIWEFRNRTLTCRNASNENLDTLMEIQSLGQGQVRIGTASTAQVGIGITPNASYFLSVGGTSNFDVIRSATRLDLIGEMYVKGTGSDIVRPSATTDYTLRVRDNVATFEFRNTKFGRTNGQMILQNDGDCELFVGKEGTARMGVGTAPNASYLLNVGGTSNFDEARITTNLEVLGEQLLNTNARIFQRVDAFNSLNVISTAQINFSLQADRTTDPTTGTIALQLDDTNGITINRAVVNNQTFNSIGNITAEASLNVWGDLLFQHSSGIKETLNGSDYDLDIRNGDTDRAINLIVGAIGSTPEISVSEASVNLLGNLDITHSDVSGSNRVKFNNPDSDGIIFHSINGANICEISSTGLRVNGASTETSDRRLKENVKEIDAKKCIELVKYIKPKTYNYIGQSQKCVGYIADDFKTKKMPEEWDNIVFEGKDDYLRMDYGKTTPILWSALQTALNKIDKFEKRN